MKESLKLAWVHSIIRVCENPEEEGTFLCIDAMHRCKAIQELHAEGDEKYQDTMFYAHVFEPMKVIDQVFLADSNNFHFCAFYFIVINFINK